MNFLKFLGTAGARFVTTKQVRASGGIWLSINGTNLHIDPGPGALVKALSSKPKLDPSTLSGIILTHKHLDHSNDVNVMIEAMTEGGHKKKGTLFAPGDALDTDPVVFRYVRDYLEKIEILQAGKSYEIGETKFSTPVRHKHPVETYGLVFNYNKKRICFIVDTLYFDKLADYYKGDLAIIYCMRLSVPDKYDVEHLNLENTKMLIKEIKPKVAVLTHFGMSMVKAKPWEIAKKLEQELKTRVIAASDGMTLDLDEVL